MTPVTDACSMVASDRISAFDHVFHEPVPGQGPGPHGHDGVLDRGVRGRLAVPPHRDRPGRLPRRRGGPAGRRGSGDARARAEMLPLECIVRGYLAGSAWKEYRHVGHDARHGAAGGAPRVRPPPRAGVHALDEGGCGHDENISFEAAVDLVGAEVAGRPVTSASPPTSEGRRAHSSAASSWPTRSSSLAS